MYILAQEMKSACGIRDNVTCLVTHESCLFSSTQESLARFSHSQTARREDVVLRTKLRKDGFRCIPIQITTDILTTALGNGEFEDFELKSFTPSGSLTSPFHYDKAGHLVNPHLSVLTDIARAKRIPRRLEIPRLLLAI